jgi:uncharacterized membrane protein
MVMDILPNWHPIFVHFTAALLFLASAMFLLGSIGHRKPWGNLVLLLGRWNLWIGVGISLITVATGLYAFNTVPHNDAAHDTMVMHRNWALSTACTFLLLAIWTYVLYRKGKSYSPVFVLLSTVAAGMLTMTGYLGGELVFKHGVGVQAVIISSPMDHHQDEGDNSHREEPHGHH